MNFGNVAMLASIIASLVAVPVASTNITGDYNSVVGNLMSEPAGAVGDVPRKVSETVGSDSFEKVVETAFGKVRFISEKESFRTVMETPKYRVVSVKRPSEKVQKYKSSDVDLEKTTGTDEIKTVCDTPRGSLETSLENGERNRVFNGVKRAAVEEKCRNAEQRLEEGLVKTARTAKQAGLFKDKVEITEVDRDAEFVKIKNKGPLPTDISNWTLKDNAGTTYRFNTEIESGQTIKVKSGDMFKDCDSFCWQKGSIWNSGEDKAVLSDRKGSEVDSYSYGG